MGRLAKLNDPAWHKKVVGGESEGSKPKPADDSLNSAGILHRGPYQDIQILSGLAWNPKAQPPTMTYSTCSELSNSINSFKSRGSRIAALGEN
jgi:hypothetical protein